MLNEQKSCCRRKKNVLAGCCCCTILCANNAAAINQIAPCAKLLMSRARVMLQMLISDERGPICIFLQLFPPNLNTIYSFSTQRVCPLVGCGARTQKATNEFSMAIKVNC